VGFKYTKVHVENAAGKKEGGGGRTGKLLAEIEEKKVQTSQRK